LDVSEQPIHELVELVRNHRLDPWDIDVGKLVTLYARKLREGETFDIRIPARVLHLAATLLRMKSAHALNGYGDGTSTEDLEELLELEIPDRGELTIEYFVPRKLTLDDLLGALREAISELPRKRVRPTKKLSRMRLDVRHDVDVKLEEIMRELFLRIEKMFGKGESPSLFSLIRRRTREELVLIFMLLIFLCSEGKIRLEQTQPFGDIFASPAEVKFGGSEGG
jgi:chromatin segregation and condensation protein Rec8/ScpA/Scc1 (kleisin family)